MQLGHLCNQHHLTLLAGMVLMDTLFRVYVLNDVAHDTLEYLLTLLGGGS